MGQRADLHRKFISIRSPLTRGDVALVAKGATIDLFQSTPLIRGETTARRTVTSSTAHFNPLPSYEGRRRAAAE